MAATILKRFKQFHPLNQLGQYSLRPKTCVKYYLNRSERLITITNTRTTLFAISLSLKVQGYCSLRTLFQLVLCLNSKYNIFVIITVYYEIYSSFTFPIEHPYLTVIRITTKLDVYFMVFNLQQETSNYIIILKKNMLHNMEKKHYSSTVVNINTVRP